MKLIKDFLPSLEPAIHNLVTQSVVHCTFPRALKKSRVIPILKQDKPNGVCDSYRPVNILSPLAKIIEVVVFNQITEHTTKHKILPHNHHGSRCGHSPTTALISIHDKLIEKAEQGYTSALVALDLSAAYDLVDHALLKEKMKLIGMDENAIRWMDSYLANRKQVMEIESFRSPHSTTRPARWSRGRSGAA